MSTPHNRPISPHLQIYRPQITSVLSITHRATGVFLTLGALALVYWLANVAGGADSYASAQAWFGSLLGRLLLLGWLFSFYYHLGNGIRHLVWDSGHGYEIETLTRSGYIVVGFAAAATLLSLIIA